MTKIILQIVFFLAFLQACKVQTGNNSSRKGGYIDSIQHTEQIAGLLSKVDRRYKEFKVDEKLKFSEPRCQKISDSLQVQSWAKADFDNNGLTDILLVDSRYERAIICILDKGKRYEIKHITRGFFQDCTFPVVDSNKIKYYFYSKPNRRNRNEPRKFEKITLIYKFEDFIEENETPAKHKIEKIEYSTEPCFGECPIFDITINADKTAKWTAKMYNNIRNEKVKGVFHANITEDKYNDIVNLLNYIDFEKLQDGYSVNWTDDQSSTLKITYDNGKVKTIVDYGLIGTYGLSKVYNLLFELRANQKWTK